MHQLSTEILRLKSKENDPGNDRLEMARPPGLEPGTYSLEGCCTIQLCYGRSREMQNAGSARILPQAVKQRAPCRDKFPIQRLIPALQPAQKSCRHMPEHRR